MKKKVLSAILALTLCGLMSTTAFAADIDQNSDPKAGSTNVNYTVQPVYTVTIPSSVELGETATISAKDVVVASGKQVAVTLTGTSGDNNAFTLKSAEGAVISYTVQKDSQDVSLNDTVLTVNPKDGTTGSTTLSFIAPSSITYAGDYTGTVTFTISVADVPTT